MYLEYSPSFVVCLSTHCQIVTKVGVNSQQFSYIVFGSVLLTKEQMSIHHPHINGNSPASTPNSRPTCMYYKTCKSLQVCV